MDSYSLFRDTTSPLFSMGKLKQYHKLPHYPVWWREREEGSSNLLLEWRGKLCWGKQSDCLWRDFRQAGRASRENLYCTWGLLHLYSWQENFPFYEVDPNPLINLLPRYKCFEAIKNFVIQHSQFKFCHSNAIFYITIFSRTKLKTHLRIMRQRRKKWVWTANLYLVFVVKHFFTLLWQ